VIDWAETRKRLAADRERLVAWRRAEGGRELPWLLTDSSYLCLVLYRLSYFVHARFRPLARVLWHLNLLITGADFSPKTDIGGGVLVKHPSRVGLAGKVGAGCVFHGHAAIGGLWVDTDRDVGAGPGLPALGEGVEMEEGALVLGPFRIGDGVHIGARCLVSKDVPAGARVVLVEPRRAAERAS
jgi:serine O-acetyltransferase